ncbi:MAG TPA: hypothetical protein VGE37_03325 [Archangium sp.]
MKLLVRGMMIAALAVSTAGCMHAKQMADQGVPMQGTSTTPAGEGTVSAMKSEDGNTALRVKVKHLAPANKVDEEANVYVVWVEPTNGTPQNVGILSVNNEREGTLNTLTPHSSFRVIITPERSGQVSEPSGDELFTSTVERREN